MSRFDLLRARQTQLVREEFVLLLYERCLQLVETPASRPREIRALNLAVARLGSFERASEWLATPNRTLGGRVPFALLGSDAGARERGTLGQVRGLVEDDLTVLNVGFEGEHEDGGVYHGMRSARVLDPLGHWANCARGPLGRRPVSP